MSQPQLVLDYASPRKRSRVRLPARSELAVTHTPDGGISVVERLSGRSSAIAAMMFGAFFIFRGATATAEEFRWVLHHRHAPADFVMSAVLLLLTAIETLLFAMVIQQTWRRTTLMANAQRVMVEFVGPLTRTWRAEWSCAEVGEAIPVITRYGELEAGYQLGELQLRPPGMIVSLFTDHRASEMDVLARMLNAAMRGDASPVPIAAATQVLPVSMNEPRAWQPAPPPDPATLQRLRERREDLHDRLH